MRCPQPDKEHPGNAMADSILRLKKKKKKTNAFPLRSGPRWACQLTPSLVNMVTGLPTSAIGELNENHQEWKGRSNTVSTHRRHGL